MRRAVDCASRDAADLVELAHEVGASMQTSGGVDQDHVAVARRAGRDRVEDHGGRVGALFVGDDVRADRCRE